jgi:hypothetical protein
MVAQDSPDERPIFCVVPERMHLYKATRDADVACRPPNILIGLSKISLRNNKSRTNTTGDAGTMRNRVLERDKETCWITAATDGSININSHICPKRMGDAQGAQVLRTFCNVQTPTASVFHPMFGITLNKILDGFFDLYNMGFRRIGWPVSSLSNYLTRS